MSDLKTARAALMSDPNFRWLMGGGLISALGDQFTLIALPWLVLKMTGDTLTLGLVIAMMNVPRAAFILFGGALVDRHSPRRVLMLTKHANALMLGALALLVFSGHATLPLVCGLALLLGLASAFSIPSGSSILPQVVAPDQVQLANGVLMGVRQVTMLAGPLLAGLLFALAGDGGVGAGRGAALHDASGLGLAFGFDCFSFLLSAWTLSKVAVRAAAPAPAQPILHAIGAGIAMVWNDVALRTCILYWGVCAFVVGGVMQVALPVLADTRLHGAAALGLLMGAHGAGSLAGMALTGVKGKLRIGNLGTTLLAIDVLVGLLLLPLGLIDATWQGALIYLVIGTVGGFMQVAVFTWIQQRVPPEMMGRAMSILMFVFMGLAPLAAAVTGLLMHSVTVTELFVGAGVFLVSASGLAYLFTPMSKMVDFPARQQA